MDNTTHTQPTHLWTSVAICDGEPGVSIHLTRADAIASVTAEILDSYNEYAVEDGLAPAASLGDAGWDAGYNGNPDHPLTGWQARSEDGEVCYFIQATDAPAAHS